jgi:hypothetical protein
MKHFVVDTSPRESQNSQILMKGLNEFVGLTAGLQLD